MPCKIYIDGRERRSGIIEEFKKIDMDFEVYNFLPTDYIIDAGCGIERKTVPDFLTSIVDKRIFKQAYALRQFFKQPLVLLEGSGLYSQNRGISANIIRGTILWLATAMWIPVIRTESAEDSANHLRLLAVKRLNTARVKKYHPRGQKRRKPPIKSQQSAILESIDGIGRNLAARILDEYKSPQGIINAGERNLTQIPGIGRGKAEQILRVLSGAPENK